MPRLGGVVAPLERLHRVPQRRVIRALALVVDGEEQRVREEARARPRCGRRARSRSRAARRASSGAEVDPEQDRVGAGDRANGDRAVGASLAHPTPTLRPRGAGCGAAGEAGARPARPGGPGPPTTVRSCGRFCANALVWECVPCGEAIGDVNRGEMRRGRKLLAGVLLAVALSATGASALAHALAPGGRRRGRTLGAAAAPYHVVLAASRAAAAPGNDDWANATPISGASGSASGTNVERHGRRPASPSTPQVADAVTATGKTVWWKWTAPASGNYVFDTAGSALEDTVLGVYTGSSVAALTEVAGERRRRRPAHEPRVFRRRERGRLLRPGRELRRRARRARSRSPGTPMPVANDGFAHRTTISGASGSTNSTNAGATLDLGEPSAGSPLGASVWYSWTPPRPTATSRSRSPPASRAGWPSTPAPPSALSTLSSSRPADSPLTARFSATAGTTYAIQVGDAGDDVPGAFTLGWSLAPVPGAPTLDSATPANGERRARLERARRRSAAAAITGYKIYRGTSSGGETLLTTLGNVTSVQRHERLNGMTYWYQVTAAELARRERRARTSSRRCRSRPPPRRADARSRERRQRHRHARLERARHDGGSARHGLQGLPRHVARRRDAAGDARQRQRLHRHRPSATARPTTTRSPPSTRVGEGAQSNERSATPPDAATAPGAPTLDRADRRQRQRRRSPGARRPRTAARRSPATRSTAARRAAARRCTRSTTVGAVTGYTDNSRLERDDVLLQGHGRERGRRERAVERAVGHAVAARDRARRAGAEPGDPRQRQRRTRLDDAGERRQPDHAATRSTAARRAAARRCSRRSASSTRYTDTTVTNGTLYYYKVSAVNAVGEGGFSEERSVTPLAVPGAPTLNTAVAGYSTRRSSSWSAPSSNGGAAVTVVQRLPQLLGRAPRR